MISTIHPVLPPMAPSAYFNSDATGRFPRRSKPELHLRPAGSRARRRRDGGEPGCPGVLAPAADCATSPRRGTKAVAAGVGESHPGEDQTPVREPPQSV